LRRLKSAHIASMFSPLQDNNAQSKQGQVDELCVTLAA